MSQITIYIDQKTEKKMALAVKESGLSKSKWISNLIREKTSNTWPDSVKKSSGSWKDFPLSDELRSNAGKDIVREEL